MPAVVLLAWIVLVATVVAYLTGVVSVRRLSPPVAGVVAGLEAVVAWVLLGERLAVPQVVGGVVVLVGAFGAQSSSPVRESVVGRSAVGEGRLSVRGVTASPTGAGRPAPAVPTRW